MGRRRASLSELSLRSREAPLIAREPDRLFLQAIRHGDEALFYRHFESCTEMTTETVEAAMIGQHDEHCCRTDGELRLLINDPTEQDDAAAHLDGCRRCRDRLGDLSANALTVKRAMSVLTDGCGTTDFAGAYAKVAARIRTSSKGQQDTEGTDRPALPSPPGIAGKRSRPFA